MNRMDDGLLATALTMRERQVLELAACGLSSKQIAQEVDIAPRTVERHIENVRHKLRARNKTHMIAKAVALDLLHIDCADATVRQKALPRIPEFRPKLVANQ